MLSEIRNKVLEEAEALDLDIPQVNSQLKKAEKDKFLVNSLPIIDCIKILSSIFLANGAFLYLANP